MMQANSIIMQLFFVLINMGLMRMKLLFLYVMPKTNDCPLMFKTCHV
jgi:hypothetical protein